MIKIESITINGREFIRTYSDSGYQIRQDDTSAVYEEAVDPIGSGRTYTETDKEIVDHSEALEEDYLKALERLGVK